MAKYGKDAKKWMDMRLDGHHDPFINRNLDLIVPVQDACHYDDLEAEGRLCPVFGLGQGHEALLRRHPLLLRALGAQIAACRYVDEAFSLAMLQAQGEEPRRRSVAVDAGLSSNGGDVIVDDIDVGTELALSVKNGDIRGNVVGGYDDFSIDATIKKGDSSLSGKTGGTKTLNLDANNGDIKLTIGGN